MTSNVIKNRTKITGLLMAAGMGSRFGGHKLRHPLTNGLSMGVQSALNLKQIVDEVICVVRPDDQVLIGLFEERGFTIVKNPEHNTGLSSSIKAGVKAAPDSDYWVIALGDMPSVKTETYKRIYDTIEDNMNDEPSLNKIIRPYLESSAANNKIRLGHPVSFPKRFKDQLIDLEGDKGAAPIFKGADVSQANEQIHWLPVQDPGVILDIDLQSQLT